MNSRLLKIVSGGRTEYENDPSLAEFGLIECESSDYRVQAELNVTYSHNQFLTAARQHHSMLAIRASNVLARDYALDVASLD